MEATRDGPDPERVVELRRQALVRAGYTDAQADALAQRLDIDLDGVLNPGGRDRSRPYGPGFA